MSVFEMVPAPVRRFARAVLPARVVDGARASIMRRFYVKSAISHEDPMLRVLRRTFTRRRPTLYHLDFHVTDHCNLNCKGCEQFSCISTPVFADPAVFERDMARMAELFAGIEQIYLMGGEPLLHKDLGAMVRSARSHFPASRLYVMSNGILVPRMGDTFWDDLRQEDCVLLCDQYPIGTDNDAIDRLGAEHGVKVEWVRPTEAFFKVPVDPQGRCDPRESFERCRNVTNCALLTEGRLYPCGRAAYAHILAERFDIQGIEAVSADSVSIFDENDGDEIVDFLMSPIPWCAHCDFDSYETYTWGRTERRAGEWLKAEDVPLPATPVARAGR